jgi:hypothetical protein
MASIRVDAQSLGKACLGRRQQFRKHSDVIAAGGANLERCGHVDPDHVPARREPKLALAG